MRSELVKFRVTPRTKSALEALAGRSNTSVSALLRSLIGEAISGRAVDESARVDMVEVRRMANAVLDCVGDDDDGAGKRIVEISKRLRDLAVRRLGSPT